MALCPNCMCDKQDCMNAILQVLDFAETRADAPNATDCRSELKKEFGSKLGRYLIEKYLQDKVIPATKLYPRRHIMQLQNQPMKLRSVEGVAE